MSRTAKPARPGDDIDAHALGVAVSDEPPMDALIRYEKMSLIGRHQAHVARLHAGIRQRAVEYQEEIGSLARHASGLGDEILALQAERRLLSTRISWLMLSIAFCAGLTLYLIIRDASCPSLPWIVRITQ